MRPQSYPELLRLAKNCINKANSPMMCPWRWAFGGEHWAIGGGGGGGSGGDIGSGRGIS